ncbi:GNAT family N-acetyltransferase [Ruminococcus sp. NK3A76]|uniref:GNAT family N-acetyltransferase n=1 Tax=Ruminococcus sp. NK3A76 TaxID=877411 RepID=UPI00048BF791|nr:GNAT family N-acetyltransferase [Ruminococcus sp. NK3A76]
MTTEFESISGSLDIIKTTCLANRIFGQHYTQLMPRPQIDYILDSFNSFNAINERISSGGYKYYSIMCDNRPAGFFAYVPRLGEAVEITEIGVIKKQRGKGCCKKALNFIVTKAKEGGARTVKIKIDKKNETALNAFKALGMQEIGEEQTKLMGDFFVEQLILALDISEDPA